MTSPVPVDAKSRALRTLLQGFVFDVLLAVVVVVLPLVQAEVVDWKLVAVSAVKTAAVAAFSFAQRYLESHRAA